MTTSLSDSVKSKFPTVHITFLSVLVGFAIEDLFSIVRETESLYIYDAISVSHWIQVAMSLMAITVAWLAYTLTAVTRRAIPTPVDSFQILALTATLFLLTSLIGAPLWKWYCAVGIYIIVGATVTLISSNQMEREDAKFRPYSELLRSWKGPLLVNFTTLPIVAFFALGDYFGFIPLWVHIGYLGISTILVVVWVYMLYVPWKKFLETTE